MPALSRAISGSGYSDKGDALGFRFEDLSVLIERRRVTMVGAHDEARAQMLMGWLRQISAGTDRGTVKRSGS
jgi:hypothetical protein